jgi:hypothetical protein
MAPEPMRAAKRQLFADMQHDYVQLKVSWGGFAGYDRWFAQSPNNALLASVSIYTQRVPAFEALLAEYSGDLPKFYQAVRDLARLDKPAREAALRFSFPPIAEETAMNCAFENGGSLQSSCGFEITTCRRLRIFRLITPRTDKILF